MGTIPLLALAFFIALIIFAGTAVTMLVVTYVHKLAAYRYRLPLVAGYGILVFLGYSLLSSSPFLSNLVTAVIGMGTAFLALKLNEKYKSLLKATALSSAVLAVLAGGIMFVPFQIKSYLNRDVAAARDAYDAGDFGKAFTLYKAAAEKGDPKAEFRLGELYSRGKGVQRDEKESERWLRSSAGKGYAEAQNILGYVYDRANNDPAEAAKWYQRSAAQGNLAGMYYLAGLCENGRGVPQDPAKARELYQKAAESGHVKSFTGLGRLYYKGTGMPQDMAEAAKWFRKAAEPEKGSDSEAQVYLALMHRQGQGVPKDDAEAFRWYLKAAGQGNSQAQADLGVLYEKGEGAPKDLVEACKWYAVAAYRGNAAARTSMQSLMRLMSKEQAEEAKRRAIAVLKGPQSVQPAEAP